MKKFILLFISIGTFFLGSCAAVKHVKDVATGKSGLTEPFHLFQRYNIYAEKDKTEVEARIYFSHYNQKGEKIIPQKVLFNDSEMKKGFLETGYRNDFKCGESPKDSSTSEAVVLPLPQFTPEEKVAKEWDFFVKTENYKFENTITVDNGDTTYGEYKINFEPAMIEKPELLKLSRSKENIIKLQNLIKFQPDTIEKNEDLTFYISQQDRPTINRSELKYDVSSNSIIIPIEISKKLTFGKAAIFVESMRIGNIRNPEVSTNSYTISYMDKNCVDVID